MSEGQVLPAVEQVVELGGEHGELVGVLAVRDVKPETIEGSTRDPATADDLKWVNMVKKKNTDALKDKQL